MTSQFISNEPVHNFNILIIVTRLLTMERIIGYGAATHRVLVDAVDHGEHAAVGGRESEHGGVKGNGIVCVCPFVSQPTIWVVVVVDDDKVVVANEVRA